MVRVCIMVFPFQPEQNSQVTALHQLNDVIEQHIPVPLTEAIDIVRHLQEGYRQHALTAGHQWEA